MKNQYFKFFKEELKRELDLIKDSEDYMWFRGELVFKRGFIFGYFDGITNLVHTLRIEKEVFTHKQGREIFELQGEYLRQNMKLIEESNRDSIEKKHLKWVKVKQQPPKTTRRLK